jgi:spore coat polysaccharide biosynthesis predicted glycosyltransferase SpsG
VKHEVEDLMRRFEGKYMYLDHTTNMAEAMLWADLAITGDGLTKYETAVTGTPSIMLSRPESEEFLNEEFEKAGSTVHLGDGSQIGINTLARGIEEILQDFELRTAMSQRGRTLVDGKGLERIISNIPVGVFE